MEITINYYGQAVSVSVEVYEYLTQADHKTENLAHEQRRHWDGREFDEYIIATEGRLPYCATPEELICQRETLDEILSVLALCTPTQRERFLLYALYDFTYEEIGMVFGCSKQAVNLSIRAVRKKFLKFFKNQLDE
ncbi:sigma-70 family RNA polymerase sigma factor [bacterium 1XD42-1]|nr:sigma-70 family RNA polymerase sigma factor [bacterium 1XD42-8]RKJ61986.1 sigma-70 family RNA polymerase sigma factor [bacterium 1XD42-1]